MQGKGAGWKGCLEAWLRRRLGSEEEGASMVETAVAMLVLLPILLGVIEFSLLFYAYHDVTDAAREACRWAAVRGSLSCTNTPGLTNCKATTDQIQSYVRNLGYPGLTPANLSVTTNWLVASAPPPPTTWSACSSGTCNAPGNEVQVTVTYPFTIAIPFWKAAAIKVSSTSTMVIAQ
jgi:Flp pilus assembly protein TadG